MGAEKPWTVQWHVTADGAVIRQRSKGDEPHLQLYGSYRILRPLTVHDLDALDDRLEHEAKVFDRLVKVIIALGMAGLAALIVGVVLGWLGVDGAGLLVLPGLIVLVAALIGTGASHGLMMSRWNRAWTEAGFESSSPVTMAAHEARDLIDDPGASSGRRKRVERA